METLLPVVGAFALTVELEERVTLPELVTEVLPMTFTLALDDAVTWSWLDEAPVWAELDVASQSRSPPWIVEPFTVTADAAGLVPVSMSRAWNVILPAEVALRVSMLTPGSTFTEFAWTTRSAPFVATLPVNSTVSLVPVVTMVIVVVGAAKDMVSAGLTVLVTTIMPALVVTVSVSLEK